MIISCCFTGKPDPQNGKHVSLDFSLMEPWISSLAKVGQKGVIIHDGCLDSYDLPGHISKHFDDGLTGSDKSIHEYRWTAYKDFVSSVSEEFCFITDLFDVLVNKDPVSHLDFDGYDLFCGNEVSPFMDWRYMRYKWKVSYGSHISRSFMSGAVYFLNAGLFGGRTEFVLRGCEMMKEDIDGYRKRSCDMPAFNNCFYGRERVFQGGAPVNSLFKGYEVNRDDVCFLHK